MKARGHLKDDSPEQIKKCLNCSQEKCTNCYDYKPERAGTARKKKPVIAFREGEEDMFFESADDAADFFHVTASAIRMAISERRTSQGYYWRYDE